MENPRRIQSEEQPEVFQMLGDGTYYYNYDVKKVQVADYNNESQQPVTKEMFNFGQVMLRGFPEYKAIVQAVIRQYVTLNEEFDLINSYNKAVASGVTEGNDITKYKEYIARVDAIKAMVKKDLNIA